MVIVPTRFLKQLYAWTMSSSQRLTAIGNQLKPSQHAATSQSPRHFSTDPLPQSLLPKLLEPHTDKEPIVHQFTRLYRNAEPAGRKSVLLTLAGQFGGDPAALAVEVEQLRLAAAAGEEHPDTYRKQVQKIRASLACPYETVFRAIGAYPGGTKFLVDLRHDAITLSRETLNPAALSDLQALSLNLKELLSLWFGVGFLQLERVSWQSPCDLLDKVVRYEAVHPVRNVSDLRVRVGPYRRCYIFTHPTMPREPLVILHIALTRGIAARIQSIVRHPMLSSGEDFEWADGGGEDVATFDSAIFYSITSTQPGLQGIDLGHHLIKRVVEKLRHEFPHLSQFSSLSPIPGFRQWIVTEVNQALHGDRAGPLQEPHVSALARFFNISNDKNEVLQKFKVALANNAWLDNEDLKSYFKTLLSQLCARYLYEEKHRGYALNSVANFHLKNGTTLWRLNWLANPTGRGLDESCGLMVNYRYFLERTETNSAEYARSKRVDADPQVLQLL